MTTTTYLWDTESDNLLSEDDGTTTTNYTNEPGQFGDLVSQNNSLTANTNFYHFDARGDTRELTDETEVVTDTRRFDAWGNVLGSTGTTSMLFQFIGKLGYMFDSTLLTNYVRARWFRSGESRWASPDTTWHDPLVTGYTYSLNQAVFYTSPSGLFTQSPTSSPRIGQREDTSIQITEKTHDLAVDCVDRRADAEWSFSLNGWPCRERIALIVQQVHWVTMACDCAKECFRKELKYWEVWPVGRPGDVFAPGVPVHPLPLTDEAHTEFGPSTRGFSRQYGEVRVYCVGNPNGRLQAGEVDPNKLDEYFPSSGVVNPNDPWTITSRGLPHTTEMPPFWSAHPGFASARRLFNVSWNCCCDGRTAHASARP